MKNKEQLQIVQHSLGADRYGQGHQYRNHYVAGGDDIKTCESLVELGYMKQGLMSALTGMLPLFHVTRKGISAMSEESPKPPKLSRSKQRYQRYLEYGDMFDSFKDFLGWDMEPERSWNGGI